MEMEGKKKMYKKTMLTSHGASMLMAALSAAGPSSQLHPLTPVPKARSITSMQTFIEAWTPSYADDLFCYRISCWRGGDSTLL